MEYKRFGGKFGGGGDSGNHNIAIFGIYLLIACVLAALFFNLPGMVIAGFMLLFLFTVIGMFSRGGSTAGIRRRRRKMHLANAKEFYLRGDFKNAREAFRKAEIYGPIPEDCVIFYRQSCIKNIKERE